MVDGRVAVPWTSAEQLGGASAVSVAAPASAAESLPAPLARLARFSSERPLLFDVTLAVVVDAVTCAPLIVGAENRWWVWLFHQALCAPLIARRRVPFTVFAVVSCIAFAQWLLDVPLASDASLLFALYTVAALQSRARALLCAGVLEVGVVLASARFAPASDGLLGSLVFLSGLVMAALLGGIALTTHRAYLASMVDRTRQLELERDQQAQLAATAERNRIAREMHDIIAHNISVMISLADGAALSNGDGAAESTAAIEKVSQTGRQALREMRRLLGVLREDAVPMRSPQPGLAALSGLLADVRAAGLPVELTIVGEPRVLDATAEATVYRVVQEGLTNALKHAGRVSRVGLTLVWGAADLTMRIEDDGRTKPIGSSTAGHGLLGMSERIAIFDGSVVAGPIPTGGWRVEARMPVGAGR